MPLAVIAIAALVAGIIVSTGPGRAEHRLVTDYVNAWARGDYARMYGMLDSGSQHRISEARFASAYKAAGSTATLEAIILGRVGSKQGDTYPVIVRARTRLFGTLRETLLVPLQGSGSSAKVRYAGTLVFPGLRRGEQLSRQTSLPPRASLLASDGTPLAEGPDRTSPIPDVASQITGRLGAIPTDEVAHYESLGYPADAKVGLNGLERIFQQQIAGTPGGTLRAGSRVLASRRAAAGHTVKTTIVPAIEKASVAAMGNHYAGIAAMNPRTGAVLALAGVAFSALQPPGSTMKIITATAALQAHAVKLSTTFPVQTSATIDGFNLQNANGEACGGTFLNAFAVSCNSVFAPLGAKIGGAKLVAMAERFGFNHTFPIPGASESTIPSASQIGDALAVGSSAIGQGKVQASALLMTDVAATIAMGGRRPIPTVQAHQKPRFVHVTSRHIAHQVEQMMIAVVQSGTGVSAQIPGVTVAGKTGTAELRNTVQPSTDPNAAPPDAASNTDAWFVGYAPVGKPKIVVGALFPAQGAGGQTAAPAVKGVLEAGLSAH
ncbi:MAG TPA: penicillin-binding transpeptidase domain-containing protein [Solirubrobacteraceae bacterium]